ncbi:MAG: ECF transporter S component [Clostridia bacterium]|nr:ECF transporter S component [Clostridia bacterium]
MKRSNVKNRTFKLVLLAMLIAILVVLGYVNIPMPVGLSITFNMIPVAIAASALGQPGSAIVGGAFGMISFLQCFNIFGSSPMGVALVGFSPFLMFVQRFVSRLLVGILTALIYKGLRRVNTPLRCGITGFCAACLNTLFFMSLLVLLFGQTEYMQNAMAGRGIFAYLVASIGINATVEMLVAALVTSAVGTALIKAKLV